MKARAQSGTLRMTREVREALEAEAERMAKEAVAEMNRENEDEIDAMVLYILHEEFGFGEKRLRRFYDRFSQSLRDLGERYGMNEYDDRLYLCRKKLREAGIDISKWAKEADERAGQD